MRRLILILADLYVSRRSHFVPGADRSGMLAMTELPALTQALRFGSDKRIDDWRVWLAGLVGAAVAPQPQWLVTPLQLEVRLDHVRAADRGLMTLQGDERAALAADFAGTFGPEISLEATAGREFRLRGFEQTNADTVDPARLLGADVRDALPRGPDARRVRSFMSEVEMWLHGASINSARQRAGLPLVSTLWPWRAPRPLPPARWAGARRVRFIGTDSFLAALAAACGAASDPITTPQAALASGETAVVVLEPVTQMGLAEFDASWMTPVQRELRRGALRSLTLVANECVFELNRYSHWCRWRRPMPWVERLRQA